MERSQIRSWEKVYNRLAQSPNSTLWTDLLRELSRIQRKISSNGGIDTDVPISVLKIFDNCNSSNKSVQILINLMRYGDFDALTIGLTAARERKLHHPHEALMTMLQSSLIIMKRVLTDEFTLFENHIPDLVTLILIEGIDNPHLKLERDPLLIKYTVQTMFLSSLCMTEIYGEHCDGETKISLGALMIFRSKEIGQCMDEASDKKLIRELNKCMKSLIHTKPLLDEQSPKLIDAHKLCLKVRNWHQFGLERIGQMIIHQMAKDPGIMTQRFAMLMLGRCFLNEGRYQESICYLINSIKASSSIYIISLSLRYLGEASDELSHYVIALRLLNVARKLCTMYELTITPTFVNKIYPKKRKQIKKKLKKLKCSYCGRKGKLMCCTACMNAVYCSKLCQKRDWKTGHRNKCDKKWSDFYKGLKTQRVFDRL